MKIILQTERTYLREYREEDAESFYRLNSDPAVIRFTGDDPLISLPQARTILLQHPIADYRLRGFGRWACICRRSDEVIGFAGFKYLPERREIDLGYRFLPEFWGRGLATEVCRVLIRHGFDVVNLSEITALVQSENVASVRVLEKCGLLFTELVRYQGRTVARYRLQKTAVIPD